MTTNQWTPIYISNSTAGQLLGLMLILFTMGAFLILFWKYVRRHQT